jgi:hypothetical protein
VYEIDEQDVVVPFAEIPAMSPGAPEPMVVANEHIALVAYHPQDDANGEVVVLGFEMWALMFGPPNDEGLSAHPLARRGLTPYGAFSVERSSWVRGLARTNAVHPYHDSERYLGLIHFIVTFHDTTFECVSETKPRVSRVRAVTPRAAALAAAAAL